MNTGCADHPDLTTKDGMLHETAKYLSPPGRGNMLYFVPNTPPAWLLDGSLPMAITEGEKKALALSQLSLHGQDHATSLPRWLVAALPGVWNWRGRAKATGPDGSRRDVCEPIPDLGRIAWTGRLTYIIFDSNTATNPQVQAARTALAKELSGRGAEVMLVDLPELDGVNGVDDLLALRGPDFVLALFDAAKPFVPPALNRTEMGNAERLVREHGGDLRYCPAMGKWLLWDGARFAPDERGEVMRLAKEVVRSIYAEAAKCEDDRARGEFVAWARASEKASQLRAMLALSESEPGIAVLPCELDSDQWILNVQNGTLDLRSGQLRPHRRSDLITKALPVAYDRHARAPRWEQFLAEVFEPHPDIIPFIARAVGYSLTGSTREECLFLLCGTGRNGKGVFLKLIGNLLGDYAGTADFSTFIVRQGGGPRDDIANMAGRRFIGSQESREGAALAESLVKWLTGGDRVRARRLYQNSTEFDPVFKLWLATNHPPAVRGTDPAIWSRIKMVPFDVSFEGREDRNLKQSLVSELPGILAWAVRGCMEWQKAGLQFPESVVRATGAYRSDCDQIQRFIEECCVRGEWASARSRNLYATYRKWSDDAGEKALTETAFGRRVSEKGYAKKHTNTGTEYQGIGLRASTEDRR